MKHLSAILFLLIVGCGVLPDPVYQKYDIVLTSPQGIQKVYTVKSIIKPTQEIDWSGHARVFDSGALRGHQWEKDIIVPAGWLVEVRENNGKN